MAEAQINSPLGPIRVATDGNSITRLRWAKQGEASAGTPDDPLLQRTAEQLAEYFGGARDTFDLPLNPAGTDFQKAVWRIMLRIPKGDFRTYGDVADELEGSARAVGSACGANPIPIIIPCHRILAAGGKLGGFSAEGGVEDKVWLLKHEGAMLLL